MNLKTFIDRPILSVAISIFLVLVGIIGLAMLPVEQYPDIAPPTIRVSTCPPRGGHQRCGEHDLHDFRGK